MQTSTFSSFLIAIFLTCPLADVQSEDVTIYASGSGGTIHINGNEVMSVTKDRASNIPYSLHEGDIITVRGGGLLWLSCLSSNGQFLFETSEQWFSYKPKKDSKNWCDVEGVPRKPVEFAADTARSPVQQKLVDSIKQSAKQTPLYRGTQPIHTVIAGETHLPLIYYVVKKWDLIPKDAAGKPAVAMSSVLPPSNPAPVPAPAQVASLPPPAVIPAKPRTPPPPVVPATPSRSQINVLVEQGLNANHWATADLDRAVPSEIRDNIVALKEDLQDEFKTNPAVSQDAYARGVRLCNALIEVLDERDQKAAHAGFRAVEANARTGIKSEALDARRNYKMSWPQFAREQAERRELKGQAVNNAAVMKARPLVEWSERAAVLRKTLDALYAQFREAVRQSPSPK